MWGQCTALMQPLKHAQSMNLIGAAALMEMHSQSNKKTEPKANACSLPIKWIQLEEVFGTQMRDSSPPPTPTPTPHHHPRRRDTLQSAVVRPSQYCISATVSGPDRVLMSDRGALSCPIYMWKPPPGPGCKGPNLEWQSWATDSWSTKEAWLSSSSQSPAAPLTHSPSIQQTHTRTHKLMSANWERCSLITRWPILSPFDV